MTLSSKTMEGNFTEDGSVDYRGSPADKARTGRWRSAFLILATEFCERVGTLGISLNLVTYLVGGMHLKVTRSANIVTNYYGTSYLTSLLGGFVADSYVGRFGTIAMFGALECLGMVLLTVSAALPSLGPVSCELDVESGLCRPVGGVRVAVLFLALYVIALGGGGMKPNVSALGADQFDRTSAQESKQLGAFFNVFFFIISMGAVISTTILVWIQDNVGRGWGFGISAGLMLVALISFILARSLYRYKKPNGSPFTHIAKVLVAAVRNRHPPLASTRLFELDDETRYASGKERIGPTPQFRFLDKAALIDPSSDESAVAAAQSSWKLSSVTEVEEVKQVFRIIPVWLFTVLFYTGYAQLTTFSVQQGRSMNRRLGSVRSRKFEIPAASLGVFLEVGTILVLAVYEPLLVPAARFLTGQPSGMTSLQRIGLGLLLGVVSMVSAAAAELKRIKYVQAHGYRNKAAQVVLPLSVFWLLPQYFIMGVGEGLVYAGQLHFFYKESPDGMRSLGTALFMTSISLGFFSSTFIVSQVDKYSATTSRPNGWLDDNLNQAQLYNFYWLLALVTALNFCFFLCAAKWYKYKNVLPPKD